MSPAKSAGPLACTPADVPSDQRRRWMALGVQVYAAVERLEELPEGYAFRLPTDSATFVAAAEYITLDRHCCKFLCWELRAEPNGGPVWLRLTGPEGTRAFLRSTLETTDLVPEHVVRAAGLAIAERRRAPAEIVA